jgi:hypothetical protein
VISDALNMHSVSKLYDTKGQLEWEAFNAGNDVLCFAENVPEGIQEILKNATPERVEASFNRLMKCKQKAGIITGNTAPKGNFDFEKTSVLNQKIAGNCITKIKDNLNSVTIFEAKNDYKLAKVSIYKDTDNDFFKTLSTLIPSSEFALITTAENSVTELEKKLTYFEVILISLFVPKAKPLNNFDIEDSILAFLGNLFKTKKCVLYVFGNPYVLNVIPNLDSTLGIIQIYQDFPEFQESAAQQLLENSECKGTLPVIIG